MFSRNLLVSLCALSLALTFPIKVSAVETPQFPLCVNPSGTLKASYDSGVHGIVGDTNSHSGSDKVYSVNENQLIQCFCSDDGTGIQTNWLKVGQISDQERKAYENDGWIFVPNGSLWGLEDTSYVAKNHAYSCQNTSRGGSDGLSDGKSDGKSDGQGGLSQGYSASNGIGGVFGLASTGDVSIALSFFLGGVVLLILGLTLRRKSS